MIPAPQVLQLEIEKHAPQWQRKVRVSMGTHGKMLGHGTMYVSEEFATLLQRVLIAGLAVEGATIRIIDRSSEEPVYMTTRDLSAAG